MDNFLTGRETAAPQAQPSSSVPQSTSQGLSALASASSDPNIRLLTPKDDLTAPKVEIISSKGQIRKVRVTCTCGNCTELECEY